MVGAEQRSSACVFRSARRPRPRCAPRRGARAARRRQGREPGALLRAPAELRRVRRGAGAAERLRRDRSSTAAGRVVGRHGGIHGFTIGQRRNLGVALGKRAYVVGIEPETATVRLGGRAKSCAPRRAARRAGARPGITAAAALRGRGALPRQTTLADVSATTPGRALRQLRGRRERRRARPVRRVLPRRARARRRNDRGRASRASRGNGRGRRMKRLLRAALVLAVAAPVLACSTGEGHRAGHRANGCSSKAAGTARSSWTRRFSRRSRTSTDR